MYILSENLRNEYKRLFGTLIREPTRASLKKAIRDRNPVICVGDMVTYTLIKFDIRMDLAVVDYKTCREDFAHAKTIRSMTPNRKKIINDPATISNEAYETVKKIMEGKFPLDPTLLIEVEGEEDLLLMPAVVHAPENAVLFYGEPNVGMVAVYPDKELRNTMIDFLGMMEDSDGD
ncbi:MAG: DUF359 domain-containing protein [Candidatus Thermoplasmatota archaeon]|jgi:hypothetical protein|nr:DUF359 domain-containing protein [Candidatus Thermoplasmatota archaeon]